MTINVTSPPMVLPLGRAGENEFRTHIIDWGAWLSEFPGSALSIIIKRADSETYPAAANITASPYTWTVTATECAAAGTGVLELRLTLGDVLGKSAFIQTRVDESLTEGATPAAPVPDWISDVTDAAAGALAAKNAAEDAQEAAEDAKDAAELAVGKTSYIGANGNWYEWDAETGAFVDSGTASQGPRGYSGLVPAVSEAYAENIELAANTMTTIGALTGDIAITLGVGVEGYDNEWDCVITQGATAYDVVLPTIAWQYGSSPTFDASSVTVVRLYYVGDELRGVWQ